jgi:hypothetical protein
VLLVILSLGTISCAGGNSGGAGKSGNSGTTPGTYNVTITGSSGSITGTAATVTLTVQ